MVEYLSIVDMVVVPILITLFFFNANRIKLRNIALHPEYRYYVKGLFLKMFGAIAICLVYVFYYGGGDTLNYYWDNLTITGLFLKHPFKAIAYTFGSSGPDIWYSFDSETGWPIYFRDP